MHQIAPLFKFFLEDLLNLDMNAHLLLFEKKLRYKKIHFSQFFKDPLQFIKNNPALVASIVLKKI